MKDFRTPAMACCWTEDGESICCLPHGHEGEHDFTTRCNHTDYGNAINPEVAAVFVRGYIDR